MQIKVSGALPQISVTNGSPTITFVGVDLTTELASAEGWAFHVATYNSTTGVTTYEDTTYYIGSGGPTYSAGNTTIDLTGNYTGTTKTGSQYKGVVDTDYTSPHSIVKMSAGDVDTPSIIRRQVDKMQDLFLGIINGTLTPNHSRHVLTTAITTATQWAKIATFDGEFSVTLLLHSRGARHGTAIIRASSSGAPSASTTYLDVLSISGNLGSFTHTGFKLVSAGGAGATTDLYVQAGTTSDYIDVTVLAHNDTAQDAAPVWYDGAAWSATTPTGTVVVTGDWWKQQLIHNMASDADYQLTTTESYNGLIKITDTGTVLTSGRNLIVPNDQRPYNVRNTTAQTITVKTGAGAGVAVPAGGAAWLYCDGTDVVSALDYITGAQIENLTGLHVAANSTGNVSRHVLTTTVATAGQYAKLATLDLGSVDNADITLSLLLTCGSGTSLCSVLLTVIAKQTTAISTTETKIQVESIADTTNVAHDDFFLKATATTKGTDIELHMQSKTAVVWQVTELSRQVNSDATTPITYHDAATWTATDPLTGPPAVAVTSDWAGSGRITPTTFANSWADYGGTHPCTYEKMPNGKVKLEGWVKNGTTTSNTVIFTLPVGMRPDIDMRFNAINSLGTVCTITVDSSGNVRTAVGASDTYTGLDGIEFLARG